MDPSMKLNNLAVLKKVLTLAKPYKSVFILSVFLALVMGPIGIIRPYLVKVMVDDHIMKFDISGINRIALILFGILFLEAFLQYVFLFATWWMGQSVVYDLRTKVFQHITSLRLRYFDTTPVGNSTTRTINDIETINSIFSEGIIEIVADILSLLAVLAMMFFLSWKLTLMCMMVLPFLLVSAYIFKERVKVSFQKVRNQVAASNVFLQEHISGMRTIQIFNAEDQEADKFRTINRSFTKAHLDSILAYAVFFPVVEIISAASLGIMVWYGSRGILDDSISLGLLTAFPLYLNQLFRPIRMLADKFNTLQMGLVASGRVFDLLDEVQVIPNEGTFAPEKIYGDIEFKNVSFAYADENVLNEINFKISRGETLAVVGSTGSGKSTIINLLGRLYDIQSGEILIDGQEIKKYDLFFIRKKISTVLQDVFLFSGSIFENITLRNPNISREKVVDSATALGAHEFIMNLPGGYDFEVKERGAMLSLGQRQLISFVRAMVYDPEILILDEATSSVDPETESIVQHAIEILIKGRTSIVIAHRLGTIRHANKVLVMDKGRVKEFGTQDELLNNEDGAYRRLYDLQFSNEVV
jgi:ATP-binding cassette, subfamily B, multidrug efflux pump